MMVLKKLWNDQGGAVISIELVLIATIAVLGMVVGLTTLRNSVTNELSDVAGAVDDVNQSYGFNGVDGHNSVVSGSSFIDRIDYCDTNGDTTAVADQCILNTLTPRDEEQTDISTLIN